MIKTPKKTHRASNKRSGVRGCKTKHKFYERLYISEDDDSNDSQNRTDYLSLYIRLTN